LDISGVTIEANDSVEIILAANGVQSALDGSYVAAVTLANTDIENEYGLKLHLDALNYKSYPGTGSTWFDLSESGNNVTLYNCGFTTTNYGGITFNGSTSYGELAITNLLTGTTPFTIVAAVTTNATTPAGAVIGNYGSAYGTNTLWFSAVYGLYINSSSPYFAGYPIAAATRIIAVTRNASGLCTLYKNGVSDGTATNTASIATGQNWRIGSDVGSLAEQLNGTIYMIRVYDKALSSTGISNLYNRLKGRYGLT
jgi:hypothetical protein